MEYIQGIETIINKSMEKLNGCTDKQAIMCNEILDDAIWGYVSDDNVISAVINNIKECYKLKDKLHNREERKHIYDIMRFEIAKQVERYYKHYDVEYSITTRPISVASRISYVIISSIMELKKERYLDLWYKGKLVDYRKIENTVEFYNYVQENFDLIEYNFKNLYGDMWYCAYNLWHELTCKSRSLEIKKTYLTDFNEFNNRQKGKINYMYAVLNGGASWNLKKDILESIKHQKKEN